MSQKHSEVKLSNFFTVMLEELNDFRTTDPFVGKALERQVQRAKKRARFVNNTLQQSAIDGFLANNAYVRENHVTVDTQVLNDARHFITTMLERYTKSFCESSIQETLEMSYLLDHWRFGPGASNGVQGTHTAVKIQQNMTCTAPSEPLVLWLRRNNPYFCRYDADNGNHGITLVQGSRLATVPKNEDTVRTIAIEPSGNMALQLAAGRYLEGTLRYLGLDITTQQPKNKAMARRGSIDDSIATIDLKSASDLISIELVRLLMPPKWFNLLTTIRSESIELPGGEIEELAMISTMGNGFTFPLMTLILTSLIYGLRAQRSGPNLRIDWTNTCVFGDDIIVPKSEYGDLCEILSQAGFVVNLDKSYSEGPFRESCGGDYFSGYDITPVYVKSLASPSEVYVAMNQVLEWSASHNLLLSRTLLYLKSLLGRVYLIPEWHNPDQGLLTAQCSRRYKYLKLVPYHRKLKSSSFDMMLAIGGYIAESATGLFYTPRSVRNKVCTSGARLPRGYLDGHDPLTRSRMLSNRISTYVEILFA